MWKGRRRYLADWSRSRCRSRWRSLPARAKALVDLGVRGSEHAVDDCHGRKLDSVDGESGLSIHRKVQTEGVRTHGSNRAAVRDDQHRVAWVLASDRTHRL